MPNNIPDTPICKSNGTPAISNTPVPILARKKRSNSGRSVENFQLLLPNTICLFVTKAKIMVINHDNTFATLILFVTDSKMAYAIQLISVELTPNTKYKIMLLCFVNNLFIEFVSLFFSYINMKDKNSF